MAKEKQILIILSFVAVVACSTLEPQQRTVHSASIEPDNAISRRDGYPEGYSGTVLRVATLNLAHGRKDSLNQFFGFLRLFRELNDKK